MKRHIFAKILTVAMVTLLFPVTALAYPPPTEEALGTTQTTVTSGSIYTISSQEELAYLSTLVENGNSCSGAIFVLTTNITITNDYDSATDGNWYPIGYANHFNGTFDGQGFTVSGIDVQIGGTSGFFGTADSNSIIRNVSVSGTVSSVGGIGKGGIVGENNGIVQNCYSSVTLNTSGTIGIGGIAGKNNGTVQNCYNSGSVIGSQYIGGIVGHNTGTVQNCYNTGNVSGVFYVGGVIGYNSDSSIVQNCYNTGNVTGSGSIGGVVGTNYAHLVQNCYWLSSSAIAGINGDTGTNIVSYTSTSGGTLTTAVGGEISLLGVLNSGVATFQTTPAALKTWVVGTTFPVFKSATEAPAFSSVTYSMPNATAENLNFTLTNAVNGATYRLYSTRLSGSAIDTVTSQSGTALSFTLPSAPASDVEYYISAEDVSGAIPESNRTQVSITAFVPPAPAITTTTLANGTMNTSYTQTLTATSDAPVTWSISAGSLPTGLSLSNDGTISGTPTTTGTFNFTVKAENAGGNNTLALSIEVSTVAIVGIPQDYSMYTGGRVIWDPTPSGGTWDWDNTFFSATFNSPATFTALQTGTSTITYTVNGVVKSVTITVLAANIPQAGQNSTMFEVLALLAVLCATAAGALYLTDRKNKNNDSKS